MKNTLFAFFGLIAVISLLTVCPSCSRPNRAGAADSTQQDVLPQDGLSQHETPSPASARMNTLVVQDIAFGPDEETRPIFVYTDGEVSTVSAPNWSSVIHDGAGNYSIRVLANTGGTRSGAITLRTQGANSQTVELFIAQLGNAVPEFNDAILIPIAGGNASERQSADSDIHRTWDGNREGGQFHSRWSGRTSFPVRLTYNFTDVPRIDFLMYFATPANPNGRFQELELWVADNGDTELRQYGKFNFHGERSALLTFDPPLINPTTVEFRVLSGISNLVTCTQMEFYRLPEGFGSVSVFTDATFSALRDGVTLKQIYEIADPFLKDLALRIFAGVHFLDDREFRVQEFRAWPDPNRDKRMLKNLQSFSNLDNPTGIVVDADEELLIFTDVPPDALVSLVIQDLTVTSGGQAPRAHHPLTKVNRVVAGRRGLAYLVYRDERGENAPPVTVHFARGGRVNGYFDIAKHKPSEWLPRLEKAVDQHFDLVGRYTHITFPTAGFRSLTPCGTDLIDAWDMIAYWTYELIGLEKYDRMPRNRQYGHRTHVSGSSPHAGEFRTAYTDNNVLNANRIRTRNGADQTAWVIAHELGHQTQLTPGLRWGTVGEVTNNLYSVNAIVRFGNRSPLFLLGTVNYFGKIPTLLERVASGTPYDSRDNNYFDRLVPWWQLQLYLGDVLGKTDFYKDLHEFYRVNDVGGDNGHRQTMFALNASKIAELDLTLFFEKWGFLTPGGIVTQEQADSVKSQIAALNLPKPPIEDFTNITDENKLEFAPAHLVDHMHRVREKLAEANSLLRQHKIADHSDELYSSDFFTPLKDRQALRRAIGDAIGASIPNARQTVRNLDDAIAQFQAASRRGTKQMQAGANLGLTYASASATFRNNGATSSNETGGSAPRSVNHMMRNEGRWASANAAPGNFPIDVTIHFNEEVSADSMTIFAFQNNDATQGRIRNFDIDYWNGNAWVNCYQRRSHTPIPGNAARNGTNAYRAAFSNGAVKSDRFRLAILSSDPIDPSIWHLQLHYAP